MALRGEIPAIFNAYRADDIDTAIRLAQEFKLKFMLSSVSEGYLEAQIIKQSGAPALVGPTLQRLDSLETENVSLENAAILVQAGVPVALMTGFENYVPKNRVLLFEAAVAAANGLGFEGALRACTIESAKILGIADRVGSLEVGQGCRCRALRRRSLRIHQPCDRGVGQWQGELSAAVRLNLGKAKGEPGEGSPF